MRRKHVLCSVLAVELILVLVVWIWNSGANRCVSATTPLPFVSAKAALPLAPTQPLLVVPAPESGIPSHWQRREINGMVYYIIPLSA
jgi:hypothetical protein